MSDFDKLPSLQFEQHTKEPIHSGAVMTGFAVGSLAFSAGFVWVDLQETDAERNHNREARIADSEYQLASERADFAESLYEALYNPSGSTLEMEPPTSPAGTVEQQIAQLTFLEQLDRFNNPLETSGLPSLIEEAYQIDAQVGIIDSTEHASELALFAQDQEFIAEIALAEAQAAERYDYSDIMPTIGIALGALIAGKVVYSSTNKAINAVLRRQETRRRNQDLQDQIVQEAEDFLRSNDE